MILIHLLHLWELHSKTQKACISKFVKHAYNAYFHLKLGDQDKAWAPHIVCRTCVENLRRWTKGALSQLAFGIPMVWREPKNHVDDCYFCLVNTKGFSKKSKGKIRYPNLCSALRPIPHSDDIPVPPPPASSYSSSDSDNESSSNTVNSNCDSHSYPVDKCIPFTQAELNDLVRYLDLSKSSAELLASRLKEKVC